MTSPATRNPEASALLLFGSDAQCEEARSWLVDVGYGYADNAPAWRLFDMIQRRYEGGIVAFLADTAQLA